MMNLMKTKSLVFTFFLLFVLSLGGCLKTRAQLKDDNVNSDESAKGVPAKVQDVQPQGQYVIDEIKGELTRIEGRLEDLERAQKESASNANTVTKEDLKKLESRIIELEQAQATLIEQVKKNQEAAAAAAAVDPLDIYEKGKALYQNKDYDGASQTFTAYLNSPKAKAAVENATFLRAESYYALKQYKRAIVDYSKITEKFPHSKQVPMALYRIGYSFEALGMKDDAKSFFQELVDNHPKSPEAKKVRSKLK